MNMNNGGNDFDARGAAVDFMRELRMRLSFTELCNMLAAMRARPKDAPWCPSHDYCDANMVMFDACVENGADEDDPVPAMNAAWTELYDHLDDIIEEA